MPPLATLALYLGFGFIFIFIVWLKQGTIEQLKGIISGYIFIGFFIWVPWLMYNLQKYIEMQKKVKYLSEEHKNTFFIIPKDEIITQQMEVEIIDHNEQYILLKPVGFSERIRGEIIQSIVSLNDSIDRLYDKKGELSLLRIALIPSRIDTLEGFELEGYKDTSIFLNADLKLKTLS